MIERIVGSKVRQLRKERGLDRDELAGRAGMTRGRIVEIENDGIQDIQNPDMWALVRALDCLPEDILDMTSSNSEREIYDGPRSCERCSFREPGTTAGRAAT